MARGPVATDLLLEESQVGEVSGLCCVLARRETLPYHSGKPGTPPWRIQPEQSRVGPRISPALSGIHMTRQTMCF
jgi:hypothetical protein